MNTTAINRRAAHDVAWSGAHALLDVVAGKFSVEEQKQLFAAFYNGLRAAIEAYCTQEARQRQRITPTSH